MNTATSSVSTPKATQGGVFVSTLSAMQQGKVLEDLDDAVRECTRAVGIAGKAGKVTLTLTITPNGVGQGETPLFKVEDDIVVKSPKKGRKPSVFFADDDCNLTRRNPHQDEIKFTDLGGGKSASPEAGAPKAAQA